MKMKHWQLVLLAVLVLTAALRADEAAPKASPTKTVRLLTVGNSFSNNATHYLEDLTRAAGHVLVHHRAAIGGGTMAQHWEKAQQHEQDPQDLRGLYTTQRSLKQELLAEPWDYITIQQASIRSHDIGTYRPYARQLYDYLRQHAPQAEILVHQTWAYRTDEPRFAVASPAPGEPATQEAMYRGLSKAYATIAAELKARRIPVGDAFYLADTDENGAAGLTRCLISLPQPIRPCPSRSTRCTWAGVGSSSRTERTNCGWTGTTPTRQASTWALACFTKCFFRRAR